MLVEWPSIQPSDQSLDCKEGRQDASKCGGRSENDGNTLCNPGRSAKVLVQIITTVDVIVSFFLDPVGTVGTPPDGDLALDDLPIVHEAVGPKDECGGVIRIVRCTEQP